MTRNSSSLPSPPAPTAQGLGPAAARNGFADAVVRPFQTPATAFGSSIVPPRLALVELGVFALIVLLEWGFEPFPDLTRISPHPYWIAILLLSLQYGVISGLIAAGIAIIGAVLIGLPPPDVDERYFNYLLRVWSEPILWLLVALLLGTFRTRQIEKVRWLVGEAQDLEARGAAVVAHAANLKARITMLERALAVRDVTPQGRLLSALAALSEARAGRWAEDFATAADLAFPGAALTVHVADEGGFHAILRHRWPAVAAWRQDIPADAPLARAILPGDRRLNALARADEDLLGSDGIVAVPIRALDGDGKARVVGMLKIESAAPSLLDQDSAARLAVLAAHVAPALSRGGLQIVPRSATGGDEVGDAERGSRPVHVRALRWLAGGRDHTGSGGSPDDR